MAMVLDLLHWLVDSLLRVDRGHFLNNEFDVKGSHAEIATELRTIVDQLKLEAFDTENGLVNYRALRNSPTYTRYRMATGGLRHFDPASLQSRGERLAFWINLYNSLMVHAVIFFGIEKSIWEAGWGFFRKAAYNIGGFRYSADDIEHGILRGNRPYPLLRLPQFGKGDLRLKHAIVPMDPRIHFALVCASRSCPIITVYHASQIEEELEAAATTFVNGGGVVVQPELAQVSLSRIFSWYQRDFNGCSGVLRFILAHLREGPERDYLEENVSKVHLKYQKYDWSLNHY
ncbi:MAG: DUF547 domain-containing protein [Dehalococcoidia bacterium]